jgi:hypothetical protein
MARDYLLDKSDYKGHEIDGCDNNCPCKPCWNPENRPFCFGNRNKRWIDNWICLTKYKNDCPENVEPIHLLKLSKRLKSAKNGDTFRCVRCHSKVVIGKDLFHIYERKL